MGVAHEKQHLPELIPVVSFTYLMLWIHSSFSSGVGAEMRYTMWFPSTTRPSASVLHALISCPRLLGMYNSKQFLREN